jgi:starch synthase
VFVNAKIRDFLEAMKRAIRVYQNQEAWTRMQQNGMVQDFSWKQSALQYLALYKRLLIEK